MKTPKGALQACSIAALFSGETMTAQACAIAATPVTTAANAEGQPAIAAQGLVLQTSVTPEPDEDLAAACKYEITLTNPSRTVQGVWAQRVMIAVVNDDDYLRRVMSEQFGQIESLALFPWCR